MHFVAQRAVSLVSGWLASLYEWDFECTDFYVWATKSLKRLRNLPSPLLSFMLIMHQNMIYACSSQDPKQVVRVSAF